MEETETKTSTRRAAFYPTTPSPHSFRENEGDDEAGLLNFGKIISANLFGNS